MKIENIKKAYEELDKYTLNDVALSDLKKLTEDGTSIKIPNENIYDKLINTFDNRRVILEKKSDILHKYYADTALCKDLTKDQQKDFLPYNILKNSAIFSLLGYTAYSSIVHRSPFLKLPGLVISLTAIHSVFRYGYNNMLEKRLETPWRIHLHRVSKGLGPTNFIGNDHKDYYGTLNRNYEERLAKKPDYLYEEKKTYYDVLSIYKKQHKFKSIEKIELYNDESLKNGFFNTKYNKDKNSDKFFMDWQEQYYSKERGEEDLLKSANGQKVGDKEISYAEIKNAEYFKKLKEEANRNEIIFKPQTFLSYETFEPQNANEIGENNTINFKNSYDNVMEFASANSGNPSYLSTYIANLNFLKSHSKQLIFDWGMNIKLNLLKRKIHFLRNQGVDEEEIRQIISNFNSEAKTSKDSFFKENFPVVKEFANESYLIHSDKDKENLQKIETFFKENQVELLKNNSEDEVSFDFPIDENNYDPWKEYKAIYSDLLKNGRKYYIVQSLPEWKFLQIRKPRYHMNENYNRISPDLPNMKDSIFHIYSIERYHRERHRKENKYHQELLSHKI